MASPRRRRRRTLGPLSSMALGASGFGMPMKVTLNRVEASEAGDYYQVAFGVPDSDEDDAPYLLIQRQFEIPDARQCFFESNLEHYTGHFTIRTAVLERNRLILELCREAASSIEVLFNTNDYHFIDVARVLRIMIPSVSNQRDEFLPLGLLWTYLYRLDYQKL